MRSAASSLSVVVAIICAQHVAHAQYTTSVICSSSFNWAVNQQNKSPCLVAAYVQGACSTSGIWDVPHIPTPDLFYNPPLNPKTECGCSIANYNLLSACAACQGVSSLREFSFWYELCSPVGLLDISTYYPTSKWPIPDGVQIPLWAQEDAAHWTDRRFNITEAQQIAASGKLIGPPLASSSSSQSSTTSPTSTPSSNGNHTAIVGGVVGGVLGLFFIGVLIWWIVRRRRPSIEGASPNMSAGPVTDSKGTTPALVMMAVPVPQRPPHPSHLSSISSSAPTSHGTGNVEISSGILVQRTPGVLNHSGILMSHPCATTSATSGIGSTSTPPSMASSTSVGQPSNEPQRMGSSSSRSMIARFVFPGGRHKRQGDAPSTLSQGSSGMSQTGILQSPPENVGRLRRLYSPSLVPDSATLEPTPYILPPLSQGSVPSARGSTSYAQEKPRFNPPSPEVAIPTLSKPISTVQAHTTQPLNTDINRMMVTTPSPMTSQMPDPPSYKESQAESREEQPRRLARIATSRTRASHILSTPSTPERTSGPLAPVPERVPSPHDEIDYSQANI